MAAVRQLVRGGGDTIRHDDALAEARAFGMPESEIAKLQASVATDAFDGIWPENVTAIRALDAAFTQWRMTLFATAEGIASRFVGIDYAAAAIAWAAFGITLAGDDFVRFQQAESFAIAFLNGGEPS